MNREAFEAWYKKKMSNIHGACYSLDELGRYQDSNVQIAWRGFQAGLAHANVNEPSQAQQSQWISVEERLPETYVDNDRELIVLGKPIGASIKSDNFLVLLETGSVKMDCLAGIVGNKPFWWMYKDLVTHWMPLPQAPEGEKK